MTRTVPVGLPRAVLVLLVLNLRGSEAARDTIFTGGEAGEQPTATVRQQNVDPLVGTKGEREMTSCVRHTIPPHGMALPK